MSGYSSTDHITSKLAFRQMIKDGTINRRELEILSQMSQESVPRTAGELARLIERNRNNVATRLSGLEHQGVVKKAGEKVCPISSKLCVIWVMTGDQPNGKKSKATGKYTLIREQRDQLFVLCEQIARNASPEDAAFIRNKVQIIKGEESSFLDRLRSSKAKKKINECTNQESLRL